MILAPAAYAQKEKRKKSSEAQPSEMRLREAEFFFTEGEKYFILEDYTKALLFFQRVVELNPENPTVHYKIAEILSKSNKEDDLQRASFSIENAIRLEKKNKYFYLLASFTFPSSRYIFCFCKEEVSLMPRRPSARLYTLIASSGFLSYW